MQDEPFSLILSHQVRNKIDDEIESGAFADTSDFLNNLIDSYFERKRVAGLIKEGLEDQNYSPVTEEFFNELREEILINGKIELSNFVK